MHSKQNFVNLSYYYSYYYIYCNIKHNIIFDYYLHMSVVTMLHIFNNVHPSRFLPDGECLFFRQCSSFNTYNQWLYEVFLFIIKMVILIKKTFLQV